MLPPAELAACFDDGRIFCCDGKAERDALLRLAVGAHDAATLQGIGPRTAVFIYNAARGRLNGVFAGKRGRTPGPALHGAAHTFELKLGQALNALSLRAAEAACFRSGSST
ncbi:hypothetical protein WJX81_003171 [Elliptochloris bilobata]|uniref:Uncharacterized protein n=1 Tax=Elliptochloris bilobata TaxID=381761 RepID=A0AAW1S923_9CHLO